MTHYRFFLPLDNIEPTEVTFPPQVSRQLARVLRVQVGERVVVLDNTGWEYEVTLTDLSREEAVGEVVQRRRCSGEPAVSITLYQCVLKGDKFDLVLQKCTELGVSAFVPVYSERTVPKKSEGSTRSRREDRWRKILAEAAEQSGRGLIPRLVQGVDLRTACETVTKPAIIPWEEERSTGLRSVLRGLGSPISSIDVVVGPEGGFTAAEVEYASSLGVLPVSLGARILRAETAAIAGISAVMYEIGLLGD